MNTGGKRKGTWDQELEYEATKGILSSALPRFRDEGGINAEKRLAKTSILLTQLRNGSRISEAREAVKKFVESKERTVEVRVRKQRRTNYRKMRIPREVLRKDIPRLRRSFPTVQTARHFCRNFFGFNTHSLRYAYVTHLGKKGIAPQLIARITGHKSIQHIAHYTQQIEADKILQEFG